jgi:hypothetical protein
VADLTELSRVDGGFAIRRRRTLGGPGRIPHFSVALVSLVALVFLAALGAAGCGGTTAGNSAARATTPRTTPSRSATSPAGTRAELRLSSTSPVVGQSVTVSGSHCPAPSGGVLALLQDPASGPQATDASGFGPLTRSTVTSDANGSWTTQVTIPADLIGPVSMGAICEDTYGRTMFSYPKVPVTVTTPYRMHVEPAGPVKPGTSLTVTSVGGGCPGIWAPVVNLWSSSTRPSDQPTPDAVYGQTGGGPTWTLVLPVPVGTAPGRYDVVGRCSYSRTFPVTYEPVPVLVTAG